MNNLTLENILLILIVIYVLYNLYKCYNATKLEKFNNNIRSLLKNINNIDRLRNIKQEEKIDILFNSYIDILDIIKKLLDNDIIDDIEEIIEEDEKIKEILGDKLYNKNKKLIKKLRLITKEDDNIIDLKINNKK